MIASGAVAKDTTAAASLTTASGMAGVIGAAATSAATVNGVGGVVSDVADGATAAALTAVTTGAALTGAFFGEDPPGGPSSMPTVY